MDAEEATVIKARSFSPVWLLPIFALILAVWMVGRELMSHGPLISVEFQSAEGIEAGKTKIKSRSVEIGVVEDVKLSEDFDHAVIYARVEKDFEALLRKDSQIWIVKPRIDNNGISGMGTLLSGAYLNLLPGKDADYSKEFIGLEVPPLIPETSEGLRILLASDNANGVGIGNPVNYKGFRVGKIETAAFNEKTRRFEYQVFVEKEYADLVCTSTRFWNESGIRFDLGAEGVSIQTGSLESMISGGVSFDVPEGVGPGNPCEHGQEYELFESYQDMIDQPYLHFAEYILLFDTSVRGLRKGASVEYRGIQVGSVVNVSMDYLPEDAAYQAQSNPVPVLIRVDPGRFRYGDNPEAVEITRKLMYERVEMGMRAMLSTGSLITGGMYVAVDYFEDAEPAIIGKLGEYETIPTISTGIAQIERQVTDLLEKLNALRLKKTVEELEETLVSTRSFVESAKTTFAKLDVILEDEDTQELTGSVNEATLELQKVLEGFSPDSGFYRTLNEALDEIQKASENIEKYTNTLNSKPNSLIFSGSQSPDPEPEVE